MKSFLTLTLVAGVAITSAQVAQAAGVTKLSAERLIKAQAQMPGTPSSAGNISFDRSALNRELARIGDMLAPIAALNDGLADEVAVPKKTGGSMVW